MASAGRAEVGAVLAQFTARAGRWVGAQIGIFAATSKPVGGDAADDANAYADFDSFRFMPAQRPAGWLSLGSEPPGHKVARR